MDTEHTPKAVLEIDEVECGRFLGSGGFCDVYEVTRFDLKHQDSQGYSYKESAKRKHLKSTVKTDSGMSRYAIKVIQSRILDDNHAFVIAAHDLLMEARALSQLKHPNIIKLHGYSDPCSKINSDQIADLCYFLVSERLEETLADRIHSWRKEMTQWGQPHMLRRRPVVLAKSDALFIERLEVAMEIASALDYVHSEDMIFRNLKPSNIGFDTDGICKLMNFGLSRPLPQTRKLEDTFKMTGKAGQMRYMAPEVFKHEPYNNKVDVYGFAHVLWEILSLKRPYHGCAIGFYKSNVVEKGERPKISSSWSPELQDLLKRSWSQRIKERPTMTEVCLILRDQIVLARNCSRRKRRPNSLLAVAPATPPLANTLIVC